MSTNSVVKKINNLWASPRELETFTFPEGFPSFSNDPLSWALNVARNDQGLVSTAMKSAFQDASEEDKMIYASRGHASTKVLDALINGVENNAAVQLQINHLEKKIPELKNFIDREFIPKHEELFPCGYSLESNLWITGRGHTYNTHCDVGDHILFQLHGTKKIRFWGPSPSFPPGDIFSMNFEEQPELFSSPETIVEVKAGEGVFFSRGTMHEIMVEGVQSVSLTFSSNYVYPLKTFVMELCEIAGNEQAYGLGESMNHWYKFKAMFFDPNQYARKNPNVDLMPDELKKSLMAVIQCMEEPYENKLSGYLDVWWKKILETKQYSPSGTLPTPPANREEILKKWEDERNENARKSL